MKKLYFNGDFLPMTNEGDSFEALVVEDGVIAFTGTLEDARTFAADAEDVDLDGACLMPRASSTRTAISPVPTSRVVAAQLENCKSFDEIVEAMRAFGEKNGIGPDSVIMGVSYDQNSLPRVSIPIATSWTGSPPRSPALRFMPPATCWSPTRSSSSWPASMPRRSIPRVLVTAARSMA